MLSGSNSQALGTRLKEGNLSVTQTTSLGDRVTMDGGALVLLRWPGGAAVDEV